MKLPRQGLFVTHEGFGNSIFRSQVVEHCESMAALGVQFHILTYETFRKTRETSERNVAQYRKLGAIPIELRCGVNAYLPFSTFINAVRLIRDLLRLKRLGRYEFIHARADYTAFLCAILRPLHGLPVVWDCRGDSVDELEFAIGRFAWPVRTALWIMLVPRQRFFRTLAGKLASSSVCVSESLREVVKATNLSLRSFLIPCPVPTQRFHFDPGKRIDTRHRLGVADNELLFIYSGSMTGYQSVEEFIWYYRKILSLPNAKVVIATIDKSKAQHVFRDLVCERFVITSVPYEEMNGLYCAADFALMTRVPRLLNLVASPTKFGEYCLTGLRVIHNRSVDQVTRFAAELGNGVPMEEWPPVQLDNEMRLHIAQRAITLFGRERLDRLYLACYAELRPDALRYKTVSTH